MSSWILKFVGIAIIAAWYFAFQSQTELTRNIIFIIGVTVYLAGSIVRFIQKRSRYKSDALDS